MKRLQGFIIGFLLVCMSIVIVNVFAGDAFRNVQVELNKIKITVNGNSVKGDNISFNGTTYIPLRAVAEMLGKEVEWDSKANTANIVDKQALKVLSTEAPTITPTPTPTIIPTPTPTIIPTPMPTPTPIPTITPKAELKEKVSGITVYITKTGSKYHRSGCRYLSKSQIPISLEDARKFYSPCSVCSPP